nr:sarcalumenin isoform X2 [Parasteatoda tepidariorum]
MVIFYFCLINVAVFYTEALGSFKSSDKSSTASNTIRDRSHFEHAFNIKNIQDVYGNDLTKNTLEKLIEVYMNSIKPLEVAYNFNDLKHHVMNEGEIFSLPMILLLGPWSTGKSTLINYILGIENSSFSLDAGAQPTTSDFIMLNYSEEPKTVDGKILVMEKSFSSLEKYGQPLLERLKSLQIPNQILKLVNFIDTPGVIENKKQQERGYPFIEICRWFIDRSDLIFLVFDPFKMDIGAELEEIFLQLKGYEAKVRIVLNKADTINSQELLRVYGSLFWNLSPLINITEPPKVYVSSFWSKPFQSMSKEYQDMFVLDEESLLRDINEVMANRLQNKIAFLRRHAILVPSTWIFGNVRKRVILLLLLLPGFCGMIIFKQHACVF